MLHDGDADWRKPFLAALAESGNVLLACRHAKVSRMTAYRHKARFLVFSEAWEDSLDGACDLMEAEARRRASDGVDKAVFYQGRQVGTVKEYSDKLLMFLLRANRPEKFRENFDLAKLVGDLKAAKGDLSPFDSGCTSPFANGVGVVRRSASASGPPSSHEPT